MSLKIVCLSESGLQPDVIPDFNFLAVLKESYVAECFTFAHILKYALAISKNINKVVAATI